MPEACSSPPSKEPPNHINSKGYNTKTGKAFCVLNTNLLRVSRKFNPTFPPLIGEFLFLLFECRKTISFAPPGEGRAGEQEKFVDQVPHNLNSRRRN